MGLGDKGVSDDGSPISCSVCLEPVNDNGERSWAKLQCSHQFHLDCIGSAFNFKGVMQCPNCRKVEKGQWLFASPSRSFPDVSMDDWVHDEDFYDISYSEMTFGVHWCPFSGVMRMPSSLPSPFDEGDYPTASYHELIAQHSMYEPIAASSASHPCPYVAYMGPSHPSSSSSVGNVQNSGSGYNNHWNGASAPSEVANSYAAYSLMEIQQQNWEEQFLPLSSVSTRAGAGAGTDQHSLSYMAQRQGRTNSDMSRSGNFSHFPTGHSSAARTGSSTTSSRVVPPHPGSVARTRDRVQALQAYFQPPSNSPPPVRGAPAVPSGSRRSNTHYRGGYPSLAGSSSDQTEGYYYYPSAPPSNGQNSFEEASYFMNRFDDMEREYHDHLTSFRSSGREPSIWTPSPDWRLRQTRSQNR